MVQFSTNWLMGKQ